MAVNSLEALKVWKNLRDSWQDRRQDEVLKNLTEIQYKKFESLTEGEKIEAVPLIKELVKEKGQLISDQEFGITLEAARSLAQFQKVLGKSESRDVPYYPSPLALDN